MITEGDSGCMTWYHRQIREFTAEFFAPQRASAHRIMGLYFGNLIEHAEQSNLRLSSQQWTICGRSAFNVASVVNDRRCHEAGFHMIQAISEFPGEVVSELCSFEGICSKLRVGLGFELLRELATAERLLPEDSTGALEGRRKLNHYWRWLKQDIYFLLRNPIQTFLASASDQPQLSVARLDANLLPLSDPSDERFLNTGLRRTIVLGGRLDFDALLTNMAVDHHIINTVAFSPRAPLIASGSNHNLHLWDAETGALIATLTGHTTKLRCVTFSPCGELIVSASHDCTIRIWNTVTRVCLHVLEGHTNKVRCVDCSPDGKYIASGSHDQTIRLWNATDGTPSLVLEGHTNKVKAARFSPDSLFLVSGSEDMTVRLWNALSGELLATMQGHQGDVRCVAFSPCGHIIASGSGSHDGMIFVWDAMLRTEILHWRGSQEEISSLSFSPGGATLASGARRGNDTVRLWDPSNGAQVAVLGGHGDIVNSLSFSPDGRYIVSSARNIQIWDATSRQNSETVGHGFKSWVYSVAFSPDGKFIASASTDYTIRIWDFAACATLLVLKGHSHVVNSVAYFPDGSRIVSGSTDDSIRVWDVVRYQVEWDELCQFGVNLALRQVCSFWFGRWLCSNFES